MFRRIRDLREDHDLRQMDVAEYLHCSQIAYSRYERGEREMSSAMLIHLAEFYGTSVDYLLGLTNDPAPYPKSKHK